MIKAHSLLRDLGSGLHSCGAIIFNGITKDMAGHRKWAKLKHQKAVTDAKKSKMFSKLVRFIAVEAKKAKGDRSAPGLRAAIEKAREANMPAENITRAIERATGGGEDLETVAYEAYGPGGTALVIQGYTDNRNRTAQEIKHLLATHGSSLAAPGAALWAFEKKEGSLEAISPIELSDEDLQSLSNLVDALEEHDDVSDVYTNAA